jgi:hypothetical protein
VYPTYLTAVQVCKKSNRPGKKTGISHVFHPKAHAGNVAQQEWEIPDFMRV